MKYTVIWRLLDFGDIGGLGKGCTNISPQIFDFKYRTLGRVAQSVGHLTRKSGVLGSIPGLATYFCFSLPFFKESSCQLLAKVCARCTG